jgi:hypothetical protein
VLVIRFDDYRLGTAAQTGPAVANRDNLAAAVETVQQSTVSRFECLLDFLSLWWN